MSSGSLLAVNAVLGGLTAGIGQELNGGTFLRGFATGVLGGGIAFAGKRVAVEQFDGAGFLGREVAALGTSIVANASRNRPVVETLVLPVGPLHVHIRPAQPSPLALTIDLYDAGLILYAFAEPRLSFDWGSSLSAGAPVFVARGARIRYDDTGVRGVTLGGIILRSGAIVPEEKTAVLAHERVHVLQLDMIHRLWTGPVEDKLLGALRRRQGWLGVITPDLLFPVLLESWAALADSDTARWPLEKEARSLVP